ncbi:hypothetical protein DXG01_005341 [Tephrocybe rancida]|nr:hypothetical protein DXG01_005341 [Tephrocybe rancida]
MHTNGQRCLQAGLFSATVTAFIIESYKKLSEDSGDATVSLLKQMLAIQIATFSHNGNNISLPAILPATTFVPTASAVAVNILWFLSLACSLAAALCVTLVQQWIRDYLQMVERYSQPQRRAEVRGYLFSGIEKWKMDEVIEFIPTLLHASLLFFFVGLCIFLGPISRAVTGAIVAIVFLFISFYLFATFAPLFDPSVPYQTPLSLGLWRLLHAHSLGIRDTTQTSLAIARESLATHPLNREDSIQRKSQALVWVYERISDHQEFENFFGSIRRPLQEDTQNIWRSAFAVELTINTVEENIFSLLHTTLIGHNPEEQQRRAIICLNLLVTIISQQLEQDPRAGPVIVPPLAYSNQPYLTLDRCILCWKDNSQLCTLVACATAQLGHRALISGSQRLVSQRMTLLEHEELRALSRRADEALQVASELREILDRVLERHIYEPCSPADIATLLQVFFEVLKISSHNVHVWVDVMGYALPFFEHALLLSEYCAMPRETFGFRVIYRDLPCFSSDVELCLYPYEVLALIESDNIHHLSTLSQTWFPLEVIEALRSNVSSDTYLGLRHVNTIFSLLGIACPTTPPTNSVEVHVENLEASIWNAFPAWLQKSRTPLLNSGIITLGPFSTFVSIMEDLHHGGTATGLLELVLAIKAQSGLRTIDTFTISQTLEVLCNTQHMAASEGSEILFVSALFEVLRWERDATIERPSPITFNKIDILFFELFSHQLHYESSVVLAERLLGDLQLSLEASGSNQTGGEHNLDIGSPMGSQSSILLVLPEDYAARTKSLLGGIDTQRKLWQDKRADPSREAAQSRLPGVE